MAGDHGNTPAAWTAVITVIAGFAAGGIVGKLMQLMGPGGPGHAGSRD
jgi:hypothetical protein